MAKTDFQSVDAYNNTFSGIVKERLDRVRSIIRSTAPEAQEMISYQIPAYKHHGYLIYFSAYTHHLSISYPFSKELLAEFGDELSEYKLSKSAWQIPHDKPLPETLIRKVVAFRMKENEEKEALKK